MTYQIGDLLHLDDPYLQDERFTLVLDQGELDWLYGGRDDNVPSGALLDVDSDEMWITRYRRPCDLASVYERIE